MSDYEEKKRELAILTAAKNEIEERLDGIRADVEAEMVERPLTFRDGDSILIGDDQVGGIYHRWSAAKKELKCDDVAAFLAWLSDEGAAYFEQFMYSKGAQRLLDCCMSATIVEGEIPAGCRVVDIPSIHLGITVTGCKPQVVKDAMSGQLAAATVRLLEA